MSDHFGDLAKLNRAIIIQFPFLIVFAISILHIKEYAYTQRFFYPAYFYAYGYECAFFVLI